MIISIVKEIRPGETRVAATPDTVIKMLALGAEVHIEQGAGQASGFSDEAYQKAGAKIMPDAAGTYQGTDIVLKIWAPQPSEDKYLKKDMTIIANFQILNQPERKKAFAQLGTQCFALELLPRISRAQSMDILSSQSNLSGYKAVLEAVNLSPKAVPLMMTAAGTVSPAKVLVLGAGVAGLQAIATAKRLGAQVFASDVRPEVKEQVESLGGRFVEVESNETFENTGGYAKETTADYQQKQQAAIAAQLQKTDIVITTAQIPGKKAPLLINEEMLRQMPSGGVVVDMAAESGGNVFGSHEGATTEFNGIKIIGNSNLAAQIPHSASKLYANNLYNFLAPMYQKETKQFVFNFADELVAKTCICKEGEIR